MDVNNIRDNIKRDIKAELKPRKLLRTALIPQTKGLLTPIKQVFEVFVLLIAQMFVSAKLIPRTHPAMEKTVTGFSAIWLMVVDASANLTFKRENIYQLVVFYGIVGMLIFGAFDFISFLLHFSIGYSHAQSLNNTASLFSEDGNAANDQGPAWICSMFPYSCNSTSATGLPGALQAMLLTYNSAILALATAFGLYQLAHLFMESAHHGQYGGKRYSQLYAPLRMVIGIGLLVPASQGFNSCQIIAIDMAKLGSGLASHVWSSFEAQLGSLSNNASNAPTAELNTIVQKLVVDETCMAAAQDIKGNKTKPDWEGSAVQGNNSIYTISFDNSPGDGYCGFINIPGQSELQQPDYFEKAFTQSGGILDQVWTVANKIYQNSKGGTSTVNGGTNPLSNPFNIPGSPNCASNCMNQTWMQFIGTPGTPSQNSTTASYTASSTPGLTQYIQNAAASSYNDYQTTVASKQASINTPDWTKAGYLFLLMAQKSAKLYQLQNPDIEVSLPNSEITRFFAGNNPNCEGIWARMFNKTCGSGKPIATASVAAKDDVKAAVAKVADVFDFESSSGTSSSSGGGKLNSVLRAPYETLWQGFNQARCSTGQTGQAGTSCTSTNQDTFGQSIFNIIRLGDVLIVISGALYVLGAILGTGFTPILGLIVIMIGSAIFPIGVSLAVMIPLMPAARFIFGIFTWLLTLFEAIVAMPVVALVMINYEGEGLFAHGKAGWFFLLQMMLRPVLMVFGLLGGVMIFDTLSGFISQSVFGVWYALWNSPDGDVLTMFLQIIGFMYFYALTLYSCANMSFQLINAIPDRILSWSGLPGGLSSSDDSSNVLQQAGSSASGMVTNAANTAGQKIELIEKDPDKDTGTGGKKKPNTSVSGGTEKQIPAPTSPGGPPANTVGGETGTNISPVAKEDEEKDKKQGGSNGGNDANIARDRGFYGD